MGSKVSELLKKMLPQVKTHRKDQTRYTTQNVAVVLVKLDHIQHFC